MSCFPFEKIPLDIFRHLLKLINPKDVKHMFFVSRSIRKEFFQEFMALLHFRFTDDIPYSDQLVNIIIINNNNKSFNHMNNLRSVAVFSDSFIRFDLLPTALTSLTIHTTSTEMFHMDLSQFIELKRLYVKHESQIRGSYKGTPLHIGPIALEQLKVVNMTLVGDLQLENLKFMDMINVTFVKPVKLYSSSMILMGCRDCTFESTVELVNGREGKFLEQKGALNCGNIIMRKSTFMYNPRHSHLTENTVNLMNWWIGSQRGEK